MPGMVVCPFDGATLYLPSAAPPTTTGIPLGATIAGTYDTLALPIAGGSAEIYKVRNTKSNRVVALKILQESLASDAQAVSRFQNEAYVISTISHPHVISIHDFGKTEKGLPFMELKYIEGPTLAKVLQSEKRLDPQRAIIIFSQICSALQELHKELKIHCALAPHHIMLTPTGAGAELVTLIDFSRSQSLGVKQEDPSSLDYFGDPSRGVRYASPEQLTAEVMDDRSDIYSLGCLLYEALSGVPPFDGTNGVDIRNKHLSKTPLPLTRAAIGARIPITLESLVLKAIEKNPDKRFQTIEKFARDLKMALAV